MPDYPSRPFLWPGSRAHELPAGAHMANWRNGQPGSAYTLDIFIESGTLRPEDTFLVVWLPEWAPEPAPEPDDPDAELVEIIARAICASDGAGRWDDFGEPTHSLYRHRATAALAAIVPNVTI